MGNQRSGGWCYGPTQASSNLSTLTVSVDRLRTNTPRALKRSPEEAFVYDVGDSGDEDLAVIDEIVRPMANEPITRRNRPMSDSDDAAVVVVDIHRSDERDRHRVAGTRIHVLEHVPDRKLGAADPAAAGAATTSATTLRGSASSAPKRLAFMGLSFRAAVPRQPRPQAVNGLKHNPFTEAIGESNSARNDAGLRPDVLALAGGRTGAPSADLL